MKIGTALIYGVVYVTTLAIRKRREARLLESVLIAMSTADDGQDNVLGAVLLFSYILAALGLTALISSDLLHAFNTLVKSNANPSRRINLVLVFAAFAAISFSSLSYHLLNILIASYVEWAQTASIPLASSFFGGLSDHSVSLPNIWTWAKSSALFQDFADIICNDAVRFWWTQQVLLLSIGWNTFMAIEGRRPGPCQFDLS